MILELNLLTDGLCPWNPHSLISFPCLWQEISSWLSNILFYFITMHLGSMTRKCHLSEFIWATPFSKKFLILFRVKSSGTSRINHHLLHDSDVGVPGMWVHKVDSIPIQSQCDILQVKILVTKRKASICQRLKLIICSSIFSAFRITHLGFLTTAAHNAHASMAK